MKTTSNLGLMKPEGTDVVDIENFNANADTLDTTIGAMSTVPTTAKNIAGAIKEIHTAMSNLDTTISDGEITTAKLADSAVTTAKLAANAVTGAKMANSTVTATQLADGAVTSAKLADSGVSAGTYKSVTVDGKGRVTAGSNPTTLSGYGITDAAPLASPALTGTPTAPTAVADTSSPQLATTAFVLGQAGSTAPPMNGTAAAGTSAKYSRADHVHPTDTTRAPLASPALTGTPTAPTAAVGTNTTQLATTAFVIGQAGTVIPNAGGVALAGTSTKYAREDHVHPVDPDINKDISYLRRELVLMKQREDVRDLQDRVDGATDLFYDMMDGSNTASVLQRDDSCATIAATLSSGATSAIVTYIKGAFAVGQEVTIQDTADTTKLDRVRITAINGMTLTFTSTTKAYSANAAIYRSAGVGNGGKLYFGGLPKINAIVADATIVSATNTINTRSGTKIVQLDNGWLVTILVNGTASVNTVSTMYVSKNGGLTWSVVCTMSNLKPLYPNYTDVGSGSLAVVNNTVFWLAPANDNHTIKLYRVDVTTQLNVDIANNPIYTFNTLGSAYLTDIVALDKCLMVAFAGSSGLGNNGGVHYMMSTDLSGLSWSLETNWTSEGMTVSTSGAFAWISMRALGDEVLLGVTHYDGSGYSYIRMYSLNVRTGVISSKSMQGSSGSNSYRSFVNVHIQKNGPKVGRYWVASCYGNTSNFSIQVMYSDDKGVTWSDYESIMNGSGVRICGNFSEDGAGNMFLGFTDAGIGVQYAKYPAGGSAWEIPVNLDTTSIYRTGYEAYYQTVVSALTYVQGTTTIPPLLYGINTMKFRGTFNWLSKVQPLTMDVRYTGNPAANIDTIALWVQRDIDASLTVTPTASIHSTNEVYSAMSIEPAINIDGNISETSYAYSGTAADKLALRLTATRSATSNSSGIKAVFGGVGR